MRSRILSGWIAGLCGPLFAAWGCSANGFPDWAADPKVADSLTPDTSITLVPVFLQDHPNRDVADVLGVFLEQEGMPNVWTTEKEFVPSSSADLSRITEAFGEFVREEGFSTDSVLFTRVTGSPESGIDEISTILVDGKGNLIFTDRLSAEDRVFRRSRPRNPMDCCALLRDRLRTPFHLNSKTRGRVENGRMQTAVDAKSNRASEEEIAAMEKRLGTLQSGLRSGSLRVYAVQTLDGPSPKLAKNLADSLSSVSSPVLSPGDPLRLEVSQGSNQQRRLWDLARGFRDHLRQDPSESDYSLIAEYLIRPDNGEVWSVHFVVCDRRGDWVVVDFQNYRHKDFQAVDPKTPGDCDRLVTRRLKGYLR